MARSMAAEMHSSYPNLRRECSMNVRKVFPPRDLPDAVRAEIIRILELWAEARARYGSGGPYLFGSFGAVDIMFAPVVTRFVTYSIPIPRFASALPAVTDGYSPPGVEGAVRWPTLGRFRRAIC